MNESFLQALLDHAADGILSTDGQGYIQSFNPAAARIFGYEPAQIRGQHIRLLIPRPYLPEHESYRPKAEPQFPPPFGREVVGLHRTGARIPLELSVGQSSASSPRFYVVIVRDIQERRQAEAALNESHRQLRELAAQLQKTREEERTRISREVHDELGQFLTGIKMDVAWLLSKLPPLPNPLRERAQQAIDLIDQTIRSTRRIASELRPAVLDNLGLVAAIEWQTRDFQARTGITCQCRLPSEPVEVEPNGSTALFRILQETLTNIARHAQASRTEVSLLRQDDHLCLEVRDNGKGIADEQLKESRSLGLLGMRERAENLGGQFSVGGKPGAGAWVRVQLPFPSKASPL